MARESNLSVVCKMIAQALVDGRAHLGLQTMLAEYFPSATCIRVAGPVTDDLLVLSSCLLFPKSLDLELSLVPLGTSAAGEAFLSGQCSFYSRGSTGKHDLKQLWQDMPESIAALCIAVPKPGHVLGGLNTQCLGSILVGIKRGDNSAVSGNLMALAYVLSSRFANAFSKVAAHMCAYYLMVEPSEAVDEQPGAKSAGGHPQLDASHSSHNASSSDSSDDDRPHLRQMPHPFEAGKHQQSPPMLTDRPPTQPLMPRQPPSGVVVHSQGTEQRHSFGSERYDSTATSVVAPVATDSNSCAVPTPASTGTCPTELGTAAAEATADPNTADEQRKQPANEPSSSSKGADQEEDEGKKRTGRGALDVRQRPFWLNFRKGELEQAFIGWHATHQAKGDLVGGFLAFFIELAAMKDPNVKDGVMASGRPFVATLSLFCILVVMLLRPQRWRKAREAYISMLLIAMAVQAVWAFTPCVAIRLPPAKLRDPVWFARLIYVEAMAVMPFMFVVRFRTLVRNQAVLLALATGRALPYVCSIPGAREPFGACIGGGILLLALIGFLLPLSVLRAFEVYARRTFLASPAAQALAQKQA